MRRFKNSAADSAALGSKIWYSRSMVRKKLQRGQTLILVIIGILIIGSIMMVGGFNFTKPKEPPPDAQKFSDSNIAGPSVTGAQKNLQLETFNFSAPPPPSGVCNHDNGQPAQINNGIPVTDPTCSCKEWLVECKDKKCVSVKPGGLGCELIGVWCASPYLAPTDGVFCLGKPVIYLYPEKTLNVAVSIQTSGKIILSDPPYPDNGWQNVEAHPDGNLVYNGQNYRELFYESNVGDLLKPQSGITIPTSQIDSRLKEILYQLGLNDYETGEFLDFWIPKLKNLNSNYILFSLIDKNVKEKIDKVIINPTPDTRIEFLAYFKPLNFPALVEPLTLPNRPERIGFTSVEWGATIDSNSNSWKF